MSDPKSAVAGARFDGIAKVEEVGLIGMITLRGNADEKTFATAVKKVCGMGLPGQRAINRKGGKALIWMSPDEFLLALPHEEADAEVAALDKALTGVHSLAVNVSDARAVFEVSGSQARDVLAKLFPVDLSKDAFGEGAVRRSRIAQVPAALWMEGAEGFRVMCFRSVGQYVFDLLCAAAADGSEVGHLA
ncbi:sarcosine oxidase subunit gamma [Rhodobacteraceae bacterium D3-12]|nr:sarcosine oxidase subunit gamma [Rhodobacteraceae bacterium D3-12]